MGGHQKVCGIQVFVLVMDFILKNLGTYVLPIGARNPSFGRTVGLGPSFSVDAFEVGLRRNDSAHVGVVNLKSGKVHEVGKDIRIDIMYEEIYFLYSEENRWILAVENQNDIGIIFSALDPSLYLGEDFPFEEADAEFLNTCQLRVRAMPQYYNPAVSKGWLKLRCGQ
jgi:hypothetical protein